MAKRKTSVDVFGYLDYRAFLRDYYVDRKENGRSFSYRAFSRQAGLKSPNYLKLVIDGDRNLTAEMARKFAQGCGLDDEELSYFVDLVEFNQASTASARNLAYSRLTTSKRYRKAHRLDVVQAAYHSTWYIPAIRELVSRSDFEDDPEWIAQRLVPTITKNEAKQAMNTLLELGLIEKTGSGRVKQTEKLLATPAETRSLHIGNYHRTMMQRASESIDLFPSQDRDISSITLCLGEDGIRKLKQRIQRFRRELLELESLEDTQEQVLQVNFQLFPLSKHPTGESK